MLSSTLQIVYKRIIYSIIAATGILTVFILMRLGTAPDGYHLLWLHPVLFFVCSCILVLSVNSGYYLTKIMFVVLSFIRYVVSPFLSYYSGIFSGSNYLTQNADYLNESIILMSVELLAGTLFVFAFSNITKGRYVTDNTNDMGIRGDKTFYFMFLLFALAIYLIWGRSLNLVQFFRVSDVSTYEDVTGSFLVLLRQIIKIALFLLFLLVTDKCKDSYERTHNVRFFIVSLAFGVLNIVAITGQRRAEQVYMALMVLIILTRIFPKHRKALIVSIVSIVAAMLIYLTILKSFGQYGISVSIGGNFGVEYFAKNIQSYFGGPQNLAETIALANSRHIPFYNIFYDILRSTFGISFLVKGHGTMTIEMFNTYIYGTYTSNGHVISSTGYSYIYFSAIFCFVCLLINLYVAFKCEEKVMKTNSFEILYIFFYIFFRFATNLYAFPIALLNFSTMILGTIGLLYFFACRIRMPQVKIVSSRRSR